MAKKKAEKQKEIKGIRTPIVAVMGHVDHGKTTLLDSLRGAKVAESEAGGITQNTRAHQVVTKSGKKITFIDTPGHEAFSQMRSRGARVTDFVLLVVAADDGLQPQTIESIEFAHASKTPLVVAINKMDLGIKSLDKIKKQLSDHGVSIEEYGGDVMVFPISALKKDGLPELIEGIELLAEVGELSQHSNPHPDVVATAFVLESTLGKKLGAATLAILKSGNLSGRETAFTAKQVFRARAVLDEFFKPLASVSESDPFWITGLKEVMEAGEMVYFAKDEKTAKKLQEELFAEENQVTSAAVSLTEALDATQMLEQMFAPDVTTEGQEKKYLNVIIKASTRGTLEALNSELSKIESDQSKLRVLDSAIGEVSERDIMRAKAAKGIVLAFQSPVSRNIADIAKRERVIVRNYDVIYEMLDEVEAVLTGLIEPEIVEEEVARALVKQVFTLSDGTVVAGCEVSKGIMIRGYDVWVERKGEELVRGKISSLKHFKEEVKEVKKGIECGIIISPSPTDLQTGDFVVAYKVEKY